MLSRRNLRIKVMQQLYAFKQNPSLQFSGLKSNLNRSIENAYDIYLYQLWVILQVAQHDLALYQRKKQQQKPHNRNLLIDFPFIQLLLHHEAFNAAVKIRRLPVYVEQDLIRQLYNKLTLEPAFEKFKNAEAPNPKTMQHLLKVLFGLVMLKSDMYTSNLEDNFSNWFDDDHIAIATVVDKINTYNGQENFEFLRIPTDWNPKALFGNDLLQKSIDYQTTFMDLIKPQLKNWEIDRITIIDTILMQMALCELLHFPTIPIKVTINEYIEIAKYYSTPKSKDFVNGILDKIMRELKDDNKIRKQGRGLVES